MAKPKRFALRSALLALLLASLAVASASVSEAKPAVDLKSVIRNYPDLPRNTRIAPNKYFVELKEPAVGTRTSRAEAATSRSRTEQQQAAFELFTKRQLPNKVKILRKYQSLFNGFSVTVDSSADLQQLASAPNVKAIYPVFRERLDPMETRPAAADAPKTDLSTAHKMTGVDRVRSELGLTGKGIKVAVIDSGIEYLHPAFFRPGMTCAKWGDAGCRVVGGHDYVGDEYDPDLGTPPRPDNDPRDCGGHGSHVAGIIGGNDNVFTGVAPEVDFLAYKVFGCDGATDLDFMLDAMEKANEAGASVINMSIGGGASMSDYPTATAASALASKGVVVACSQGNNGEKKGLFWGGSPGAGRSAFGTGSFDNVATVASAVSFGNVPGLTEVAVNHDKSVAAKFPTDTPLPIKASPNSYSIAPGTGTFKGDGCDPFPAQYFKDKVALVRRGGCTFAIKALNAQAAGATGMVAYNLTPELLSGVAISDPKVAIPVSFISGKDGEAVWDRASKGVEVTLTVQSKLVTVPNLATGGQPSGFSSFGPGAKLEIKPDLSAPGGNIYSAYPLPLGSYATLSGTSMASPYLAGAAVLAKQANPNIKFGEMQRRAQGTAKPAIQKETGLAWPTSKQGAGLVDAFAALTNNMLITPHKLEWLDGNHRRSSSITIVNNGPEPITYTVSHQQAASIFGSKAQQPPSYFKEGARLTFDAATITIVPGKSAKLTVAATVAEVNLPAESILSGFVVLTPTENSGRNAGVLRIPYQLLNSPYGDYQVVPDADAGPFPLLSEALLGEWPGSPTPLPNVTLARLANETAGPFTLKGMDRPVVMLQTYHVVRMLALTLFDAATNKKIGYAFSYPWKQPGTGFFPFTNETNPESGKPISGWSGEYTETLVSDTLVETKYVEDGEYYFVAEIARPGTNDKWQDRMRGFWQSPKMIVRRESTTTATSGTSATATATTSLSTSTQGPATTTTTQEPTATSVSTTTTAVAITTTTATSTQSVPTTTLSSASSTTATTTTQAPTLSSTATSTSSTTTDSPTVPTDEPGYGYGRRPRKTTTMTVESEPTYAYGRRPRKNAGGIERDLVRQLE